MQTLLLKAENPSRALLCILLLTGRALPVEP